MSKRFLQNISLRSQVIILVTVLAIGLIGAIVYLADAIGTAKESIIRLNRDRLASITDNLARRYGLLLNFIAVTQIADTALSQREELNKLLQDITMEELSKARDIQVGFYYSLLNRELVNAGPMDRSARVPSTGRFLRALLQSTIEEEREQWSHHQSGSENFILVSKPVFARNRIIGAAWTVDDLSDEFAEARPQDIIPFLQLAVIVGILLASFFVINLRREVSSIQRNLEAMKGDISQRLPTSSSELGHISSSINDLAETIYQQQVEREALQKVIQQKEKLASLGQLIAGVAHEIRTPVTAVRTRVQLWQRLMRRGKKTTHRAFTPASMQLVVGELDRIEHLVRKLLFFSKQRKLRLRQSNLHDLLNSALEIVSEKSRKQKVRVRTDFALQDSSVYVDVLEIEEVILNLLTNALEAMPSGGTLLVSTFGNGIDARISFAVEDSGMGIQPEVAQKIFDPFFTTKETGMGLGLSIAYEVVRSHNGTIEFTQGTLGGSRFVVTLPRDARKQQQ
jgi:signal transduction histidine kinase